jgi:hypothetical protein
MRPVYLLALLPLLFSPYIVSSAIPLEDVSALDAPALDDFEDYGAEDFADNDEDIRGGHHLRKAVHKILRHSPHHHHHHHHHQAPSPVIRLPSPAVLPVSLAIHKIVPVAPQSEKADKVANYISILNTDIDKNHKAFLVQYEAELAKLREISKRKIYTEEEYLKAQRELNGKYKVWKDTLHAFSISNSTLTALRHNGTSYTEEKNLLTHLYEYVKIFSTKQGYYKHNCVCNATISH